MSISAGPPTDRRRPCAPGCRRRLRPADRSGFVLVSALLVLALLTALVVSMFVITQNGLRANSQAMAQQQARDHAMFALKQAIGELQQHAGPDTRVTAPASVLDADPLTADIEGLAHPHWIGVWDTRVEVSENGELTDAFVVGNHRHQLSGGGSNPDRLNYLVDGRAEQHPRGRFAAGPDHLRLPSGRHRR